MTEDHDTQREIAQDTMNAQIMRSLGRLEGKMDNANASVNRMFSVLREHEERITQSETSLTGIKVKLGVAGALIGAVFSAAVQYIWDKFFNHTS